MAMSVGSAAVSVDSDGVITPTISGMAGTLYTGLAAAFASELPAVPVVGNTDPPYSAGRPVTAGDKAIAVTFRQRVASNWAKFANGLAPMVTYIVGNAEVAPNSLAAHVTSQSLGRTPSPNNANVAIQAPTSPVDIPLTGAGAIT